MWVNLPLDSYPNTNTVTEQPPKWEQNCDDQASGVMKVDFRSHDQPSIRKKLSSFKENIFQLVEDFPDFDSHLFLRAKLL